MAVRVKTFKAVTVATAGQRKPLSDSSILVYSATVQSLRTNTGYQYIGDSTVTSDNGQEFGPSDTVSADGPPSSRGQEQYDLADIFVDSSTDGAEFRISAWIRV